MKLVAESLEELKEELIGFARNNIEIYKNPQSLYQLEGWERAISDEDGNLYVAETYSFIHTNLLEYLQNKSLLKTNAKYDKLKGVYINCAAWQRQSNTNNFYLSESYDENFIYDEKIYEEVNDLKELAEITNPQFNFYLQKIKENKY